MKKLLLVFCLLFGFAEAHVSNWPLRPSADLRDDAMKQIKAFTEKFPQDAAVARAKEILADETLQKDMHAWMRPTMDLALDVLDRHPVSPDNEAIRKAALIILDYPIHVNNKADEPDVNEKWQSLIAYYQQRALKKLAETVKKTVVPAGKLAIWKVYNMGYIIKSEHHCIAWDIVRTNGLGQHVNELNEPMAELLKQIECMFISHWHGDHLQMWCAWRILKDGKPVFTPEIPPRKVAPAPNREDKRFTYVWKSEEVPAEGYKDVKFKVVPGHQQELLCSLFAVTIDGLTVMQTGDNQDRTVFDHFAELGRVDVLIGTCWSFIPRNCLEVAKSCKGEGIERPQFYITGHENEMGHPPTNRESFMESYKRIGDRSKLPMPSFILNVGEGIWYPNGKAIQ